VQELRTIEEEKTKVVLMSAEAEAQRVVFLEGEMKRAEALEEELLSREEEELRLREERRRLVEALALEKQQRQQDDEQRRGVVAAAAAAAEEEAPLANRVKKTKDLKDDSKDDSKDRAVQAMLHTLKMSEMQATLAKEQVEQEYRANQARLVSKRTGAMYSCHVLLSCIRVMYSCHVLLPCTHVMYSCPLTFFFLLPRHRKNNACGKRKRRRRR